MEKYLNIKKIISAYLIIFSILMLVCNTVNTPVPQGEWDDYSLPIASILNEGNFSISEGDVRYYKELFPEWSSDIESCSLSGYTIRDGSGQLTWYFPIYSIACIPYVKILQFLSLPTIYSFTYTNLSALILAICILNKFLKTSEKKKLILVLLLTLNPIVFYLNWISAEALIYSMLLIGLMCWYNKWYKRAAIFVSIAGMMNPIIMVVGMVMIAEYIIEAIRDKKKEDKWILFAKAKIPDVVKYGCCYIIGIIPMIYNYYHVGHINLTASLETFTKNQESLFSRFWAYLLDLNYGILPYYTVIFVLSLIFLIVAVLKKYIRYIEWFLTFIVLIILYSLQVHINCGMSGIARYNTWSVSILIFAVVLIGPELLSNMNLIYASYIAIAFGSVVTGVIVFLYRPYTAQSTGFTYFAPIAGYMLDHYSWAYNPLKSTFNSRVNHVDGGYDYETPIVYKGSDGYVRKILATEFDKEKLLNDYASLSGSSENFANKVNNLHGTEYISFTANDKIVRALSYEIGRELSFSLSDSSGMEYTICGMNDIEDWGTWSEENVVFQMKLDSKSELLHCEIEASAFNDVQDVTVSVNNQMVYKNLEYRGEGIKFDFVNPGEGNVLQISVDIPNAAASKDLGISGDTRVLGLGFFKMIITEGNAA